MLPKSVSNYGLSRGKTKQGDWICLKCSNYNYSFRKRCNRCFLQDKGANQYELSLIGTMHYGQLCFPSVLFLQVDRNGRQTRNYQNEGQLSERDFDKQNFSVIENRQVLSKQGRKLNQRMKKTGPNNDPMGEKQFAECCKQSKEESDALVSNLSWINRLIA